jgi:hypothetical protein
LVRHALFQLAAGFLVLASAAPVAAHGGASPSLVVTVDHVDPGGSVPIIAKDFGTDSRVLFELAVPGHIVELGHWMAGPDGHFNASFQVPADFPLGWADLVATGDDGSSTSAQVLVGATSAAPPRPSRVAPWWQDPAALLLAGLLLAGGIGVAVVFLRTGNRRPRSRTRSSR